MASPRAHTYTRDTASADDPLNFGPQHYRKTCNVGEDGRVEAGFDDYRGKGYVPGEKRQAPCWIMRPLKQALDSCQAGVFRTSSKKT